MSRTGGNYWEGEKPVETEISRLVIRYFPKAGVVQFYNKRESGNGVSKGVTLHMDQVEPEHLNDLVGTMQAMVTMEKQVRASGVAAPKPAAPEKRTFTDALKDLGLEARV